MLLAEETGNSDASGSYRTQCIRTIGAARSVTWDDAEYKDFDELARRKRWLLSEMDIDDVPQQEVGHLPYIIHDDADHEIQKPDPIVRRGHR